MIALVELGKRSQLARGARYAGGLTFCLLGTGIVFADVSPDWLAWVLFALSLAGLGLLAFWRCHEKEESESEDLVEKARQAIRNESDRLDRKRANLEKVLTTYGEWMEFPDFKKLEQIDWRAEDHTCGDARVAEIIDRESDVMLERFSTGYYWSDSRFDTRTLLLELFEVMEEIAHIYQPGSERPILETNLEELLKAINRASLQIILLLEEIPLIEIKGMNIRKLSDNIRRASKVYRKYEELQPLLEPVRYLFQGSKLLLASNPLLAAGWIAGTELMWKSGKKVAGKAFDAYLLSLVRQTLGIIAWETAGIYDGTHRYRSPDWIFGVELAHLLSKAEPDQPVLRAAFQELGNLSLRSSYDRIFLYRCVAQHASPKPRHFAQPELMTPEVREDIYQRITKFYDRCLGSHDELADKKFEEWRRGLLDRLGLGERGRAEAQVMAND